MLNWKLDGAVTATLCSASIPSDLDLAVPAHLGRKEKPKNKKNKRRIKQLAEAQGGSLKLGAVSIQEGLFS